MSSRSAQNIRSRQLPQIRRRRPNANRLRRPIRDGRSRKRKGIQGRRLPLLLPLGTHPPHAKGRTTPLSLPLRRTRYEAGPAAQIGSLGSRERTPGSDGQAIHGKGKTETHGRSVGHDGRQGEGNQGSRRGDRRLRTVDGGGGDVHGRRGQDASRMLVIEGGDQGDRRHEEGVRGGTEGEGGRGRRGSAEGTGGGEEKTGGEGGEEEEEEAEEEEEDAAGGGERYFVEVE
mmetsp:Transcript_14810/g.22469  ORF Transcript_14810/g.22469 Transcript_14810/m.22469 type:complete len:230 (-) Transcript_14810:97-786(-)